MEFKDIKSLLIKNKTKVLTALLAFLIVAGGTFAWFLFNSQPVVAQTQAQVAELPRFTADELSAYDGSNPDNPIYIGYQGKVYDVTAGKDYYQLGGSYHYLAGKDSTKDLNLFGGDIIKREYPVFGLLK
ncbi:hypothetical protein KC622_01845 [Candidatus Dojkabacteria bacterium]|uniref:Cytochrome b5 heme-binding domain-containing protein n=1 Tax=Candidatus Dojkabacteria bacterium TaxID=2099670 RepID=A0A955HYR5_9BACT|nr:hypothetical protein [Candidatus Dojkabacteria bacterium]MCB9790956.1 hypothetical protein [Candidatus Nomurabacteria bacterium]